MIYKKKAAEKAIATLLVSSVVTASGVALSCYTFESFNSIAFKGNEIKTQELNKGLNSLTGLNPVFFDDSATSTEISDNNSQTTTKDADETPPYPGDGNERSMTAP